MRLAQWRALFIRSDRAWPAAGSHCRVLWLPDAHNTAQLTHPSWKGQVTEARAGTLAGHLPRPNARPSLWGEGSEGCESPLQSPLFSMSLSPGWHCGPSAALQVHIRAVQPWLG